MYFIKFICLIAIIFLPVTSSVFAQNQTGGTNKQSYPNYKAAMQAGESFALKKKYDEAIRAFDAAFDLAKTGTERANSLFGAGEALLKVKVIINSGGRPARTKTEYGNPVAAREKFNKVIALVADVPLETKIKAHYAIADSYAADVALKRAQYAEILKYPNISPEQKAEAHLTRAASFPLTTTQNAQSALADYTLVAALEKISDETKAKALLGIAPIQGGFKQFNEALAAYLQVTELKNATDQQKASALIKAGDLQARLSNLNEARTTIAKVLALKNAPTKDKIDAHLMIANSYFFEKNVALGEAELVKISKLPNLDEKQKADIFEKTGDLLLNAERFAAARAEFGKVLVLSNISPNSQTHLNMKIGKTFIGEKNYAKAIESFNKAVAVSGASDGYKEESWLLLGDIYAHQKKFAEARETYKKITPNQNSYGLYRVGSILGAARVSKELGDAEGTASFYVLFLRDIPTYRISPAQTPQMNAIIASAQKEIWETADNLGKTDQTAAESVKIYHALANRNQFNIAEKNRAYLAIGDIYFRQNKLAEAKEAYLRVTSESRNNTKMQDEALKKVREIDAKMKVGVN